MGGEIRLNRRAFLRATSASAATLALGLWRLRPAPAHAAAPVLAARTYSDWQDVYRRQQWTWDRVVRTTHYVNCWYQANCNWNVYVKDGIVWREEQVADYPQTRSDIPDWNPRGCQKGGCFSERMYDAGRVRYPLKRVGPRGSGRWQRLSWDQALQEIADSLIDTVTQEGTDRVIWDLGPLYSMGTMSAAQQRFAILLDSTSLDVNTEIGDGHRGAAETFGKIVFERSADDYFLADLILIWGANPIYTQIPNAHFLTEARYKGASIVTIAPDYNPSSIHADLWVPVKPGCDAALGLGMAHVLIEEDLIDHAFVREQTDLPLLVREDTRTYLRASDLRRGGREDELFFHDARRGITAASRRTLRLEGLEPILEGSFEVKLHDGSTVRVRTVFSLLRERLRDYTPEKAQSLSGTPAAVIRSLAHKIAGAKSAGMVTTSSLAKYYHGNLIERVQALVFALTGNFGKKGSGFVAFPFLVTDGLEPHIRSMFSLKDMMQPRALRMMGELLVDEARMRLDGFTEEMISYEHTRKRYAEGMGGTSSALFWYVHGGLIAASDRLQEWDPSLKRPVRDVLDESLEKGWQALWPKPGDDPRILFVYGSNLLRRLRSYPLALETLWPKLRTVVTLDFRMTSTALHSDYVLPSAAWYERTEHKWATTLMPFLHAGTKATTYYEAKSDWEIVSRLAETVDRRARERGIERFVDRHGGERTFGDLYDRFSQNGLYGHLDDDKVAEALLEASSNVGDVKWEELKERGWTRFTDFGHNTGAIGNMTKIEPDDTITPFTKHVFDKEPYPTLSRRIQFYIDHELYLEMGEELPVHKAPPTSGGDHPLMLTGGHARWSIHSTWRDDSLLLRQQRGVPLVYMSTTDAAARGIRDGERVRVRNDMASFEIQAKVTPAVRPGQLILYHAWENFQFKDGKGYQNLIPTPLNPVELAGGQFHLRPMMICLQPSHTDRDTRVEVERLSV
jgi:DMSO reductase family type II enzyme molybdopterin subunit